MITNHRLSILHRPKRPLAAQKNVEHADQEFQKEQVTVQSLRTLLLAVQLASLDAPAYLLPLHHLSHLVHSVTFVHHFQAVLQWHPCVLRTPFYMPCMSF